MVKHNFEYDSTGNTFYCFLMAALTVVLLPTTAYFWNSINVEEENKKKKFVAHAANTLYYDVTEEKMKRMQKKDPYKKFKRKICWVLIAIGWIFLANIIYEVYHFDYEMAEFDPFEMLEVGMSASPKEVKAQYRKMSLKYHPDKPDGDEKKFMKLTMAYKVLTDKRSRRNWEHYGHPDGPQATKFGIALPDWLVASRNAIIVLGIYTFFFMGVLPFVVWRWWSNSSRISGEQVLLDTTQLYYYFFHKTPNMILKRVLMVLAGSLEFEPGHNSQIRRRESDKIEMPMLVKYLPHLGLNNKEKPLCFEYSIKARALLQAHLSKIPLPKNTLHQDRLYIVQKCPYLLKEMITCISQLILLAHAGRISKLPTLDSVENAMKLSPLIVQALWEKSSPLLQLPHIEEDMLKHFCTKKRKIQTIKQLAEMEETDRRSMLRSLNDDQYKDMIAVLKELPLVYENITTEVVHDEEDHLVTAGSLITMTIMLTREKMETIINQGEADEPKIENEVEDLTHDEMQLDGDKVETECSETEKNKKSEETKKKPPAWLKQHKKKPSKKNLNVHKKVQKPTGKNILNYESVEEIEENGSDSGHGTDGESSKKSEDDEEREWQKFQKKLSRREKAILETSKESHSVHCPFFTDDKQEYWWIYVSDHKKHELVTAPYHITNLVYQKEVELRFTAPHKPGLYTYFVHLRSDSYIGLDVVEEIKVDVKEARQPITEHPQWKFNDNSESEEVEKEDDNNDDSEYATDSDVDSSETDSD